MSHYHTYLNGMIIALTGLSIAHAAEVPPQELPVIHQLVKDVTTDRLESDIRKLVSFGTRHTLSETKSETRGIGAARRWIKAEF